MHDFYRTGALYNLREARRLRLAGCAATAAMHLTAAGRYRAWLTSL